MSISVAIYNIQSPKKLLPYMEIMQRCFLPVSFIWLLELTFSIFDSSSSRIFFQVWLSNLILSIRIHELFFCIFLSIEYNAFTWVLCECMNTWKLTWLLECGLWLSFPWIFYLLCPLLPQETDIYIYLPACGKFLPFSNSASVQLSLDCGPWRKDRTHNGNAEGT